MKQFLAIVLAFCMMCSILPFSAMAEEVLLEEEFLLSEELSAPELKEDLLPEEPYSDPLPEELLDLPACLEEVPLPETLEEATAFEKKEVSGFITATQLSDNEELVLTGDTTLIMNIPKTIKSISGNHTLSVKGDCTLTVINPDGYCAINIAVFYCSAPLDLKADVEAIHAEGDITIDRGVSAVGEIFSQSGNIVINGNASVRSDKGHGIFVFDADISINGGTVNITSNESAIHSRGDITLSGNITAVTEDGWAAIIARNVTFLGGTLNATAHSNSFGIYAGEHLSIKSGSVAAYGSRGGIISGYDTLFISPLAITSPPNGYIARSTPEMHTLHDGMFVVLDENGYLATSVRIEPSPVAGFVERCYQLILGRPSDPQGVEYWTNALSTHQATGAELVALFCTSQEFADRNLSTAEIVKIIYRTMLNRDPDTAGLNYWVDQTTSLLSKGCSLNPIIAGFAGSAEFAQICANYGITPGTVTLEPRDRNPQVTAFVNRCYLNTVERRGDPDGLNFWTEQLLNKTQTPQQVAKSFLSSGEFIARNLSDGAYLECLYKLYMGHMPDDAGLQYWKSVLASGVSRSDVADSFGNSAEFLAIIKSYGL